MRTFARSATASGVKLSVVPQSPANGATVSGAIAWEVKASSSRVYRVDFAIDGAVRSSDSHFPFAYGSLDTTALANGRHSLTATAYARGARPASASVSVDRRQRHVVVDRAFAPLQADRDADSVAVADANSRADPEPRTHA